MNLTSKILMLYSLKFLQLHAAMLIIYTQRYMYYCMLIVRSMMQHITHISYDYSAILDVASVEKEHRHSCWSGWRQCYIWKGLWCQQVSMMRYCECRDFSVAPVDMKRENFSFFTTSLGKNLSCRLFLLDTFTLRTRASSRNISYYQVQLSRYYSVMK